MLLIIIIAAAAVVAAIILFNVLGDKDDVKDNGRDNDRGSEVVDTDDDDDIWIGEDDDSDTGESGGDTSGSSGNGVISPGQSSIPWPKDWPMYPDGELGPESEYVGGDNVQYVIQILNTSKASWLEYLDIVMANEQWVEWGLSESADYRTDTTWAVGFPAFWMEATIESDSTTVIITESLYP